MQSGRNACASLESLKHGSLMLRWRWGVLLVGLLAACQPTAMPDVRETRLMLGTVVVFTIADMPEDKALAAIKQAAEAMQAVEAAFTTHGDIHNTVKALNQAKAGQAVRLAPEVDALLQQAVAYQRQTQGAFDPTLGALNRKWGFSGDVLPSKPLSQAEVRQALAQSGVSSIHRIKPLVWVKDKAKLQLDFGAIAKGFAIDKGVETLRKMGVRDGIINAGGDMRILGRHGRKPWRIAIQHPRKDAPLGWLEVQGDSSMVTSGDYERFFMYQGVRYHHIIDPKTGFPSRKTMSVTVQAPTATQADALSTALFVLGDKQGLALVETLPKVEALWVSSDGVVHMSRGMQTQFHAL